jgi:hypothetical protein
MESAMQLEEGLPYLLGATWNGKGTNFAPFSDNATKVEVCNDIFLRPSQACIQFPGSVRVHGDGIPCPKCFPTARTIQHSGLR